MAKRIRQPWRADATKPEKTEAARPEGADADKVGLTISVTRQFRRDIHILAAHRDTTVSKILMDAASPLLKGMHVRFGRGSAGGGEQPAGGDDRAPEGDASGADDGLKIAG